MGKDIKLIENYVNTILENPGSEVLDIQELSAEFQSLGKAVRELGKWAVDARAFAKSLAEDSSESQTIGEDFNAMLLEFRKRTSALENERNLFLKFTESASERIIVLDKESGEMVYANRIARRFFEKTKDYIDTAEDINALSGCSYQNTYSGWLHTVCHPAANGEPQIEYYQVHSLYILWEGRDAIAHMFSNVTEQKANEALAMKDSLTGTFSRIYVMNHLEKLCKEDKSFTLGFIDLDYLKYCNDTFGHSAGDAYLIETAAFLSQLCTDSIIARNGGDEFIVVSEDLSSCQLQEELAAARNRLGHEYFQGSTIRKSFSYGIVERCKGDERPLQKLLAVADERMYVNKLENKKQNHLQMEDERLKL